MEEKLCFVIMGFGKKTDLASGNTFDLDKTYKNIILDKIKRTLTYQRSWLSICYRILCNSMH